MARKGLRTKLCSKCNQVKELSTKRYCRTCANAYMVEWRKYNPASDDARVKANTRSKTKVYVTRGLIEKKPCEVCESVDVQAHHNDYTNAYDITWLCSKCHQAHHVEQSYNAWKWKQHTLDV